MYTPRMTKSSPHFFRQTLEKLAEEPPTTKTALLKSTTMHQEFRVLRRMLNIAVRKKLLAANPCSGVEFPVAVKGLFRPHYVTWSEQERIESHGPEYLRNIVQIITETGLRVYKELAPTRKDQVDLSNAVVWIPDSKTPNGIAEVPLTPLAVEALRRQMAITPESPFSFRVIAIPGVPSHFQDGLEQNASPSKDPLFPDLRPSIHLCYAAE